MDNDRKTVILSLYRPLILHEVGRYVEKIGDMAQAMMDDLVQVASLGLLSALDSFDPGRSPAIIPYLRKGVDMAIMGELSRNLRLIRQPKGVQASVRSLRRACIENPGADDDAICRAAGLSPAELVLARKAIASEELFHIDADPDACGLINDGCGFEDEVADNAMVGDLECAIDRLDDDDKFIIKAYTGTFGERKLTDRQLAGRLSCSIYLIHARIRHIMYALSFDLGADSVAFEDM